MVRTLNGVSCIRARAVVLDCVLLQRTSPWACSASCCSRGNCGACGSSTCCMLQQRCVRLHCFLLSQRRHCSSRGVCVVAQGWQCVLLLSVRGAAVRGAAVGAAAVGGAAVGAAAVRAYACCCSACCCSACCCSACCCSACCCTRCCSSRGVCCVRFFYVLRQPGCVLLHCATTCCCNRGACSVVQRRDGVGVVGAQRLPQPAEQHRALREEHIIACIAL